MKINVAILGAGITGLSLAWYLKKRHQDNIAITIFETKDRVGGWINTIVRDGELYECGPRSIRNNTPELCELIKELGLEGDKVVASLSAKKRYLVHQGKLEPLPYSFTSLFTLKLGRKALRGAIYDLFSRPQDIEDESVESFFTRHIGRSATKTFISALTAGIYASDPSSLSMRSCFPAIWEKAKRHGTLLFPSFKKAPKIHSFTFKGGMATLPRKLQERVEAELYLNASVSNIREIDSSVQFTAQNQEFTFDKLYCCGACSGIKTSLATVSLSYEQELTLPQGFGFLCPSHEDPILLGVVFDSCLFPEQNGRFKTRLTIMMGGEKAPLLFKESEEVLLSYAMQFIDKYLKIKKRPSQHFVFRAENAISRYAVGHHRLLESLEEPQSAIRQLGSSFHGVSVGECVAVAKRVAEEPLSVRLGLIQDDVYKKQLCS